MSVQALDGTLQVSCKHGNFSYGLYTPIHIGLSRPWCTTRWYIPSASNKCPGKTKQNKQQKKKEMKQINKRRKQRKTVGGLYVGSYLFSQKKPLDLRKNSFPSEVPTTTKIIVTTTVLWAWGMHSPAPTTAMLASSIKGSAKFKILTLKGHLQSCLDLVSHIKTLYFRYRL